MKSRRLSILLVSLLALPAMGGTFYVRPAGGSYGSENGSSWANAFDGFSDVTGVGAGDTLYVAAGTYDWTSGVGISGATNNRVRVLAAQDTHVGLATFSTLNFGGNDFIEFNGQGPAGETNFNVDANWVLQYADYGIYKYFTATNNDISAQYLAGCELGYFVIDDARTDTNTPLYGENARNPDAYDQTILHHFTIILRQGREADGYGPDGIHVGTGWTMTNFTIIAFTNSAYNGSSHQDLMQIYGDDWVTIRNGEFINTVDSQVDFSYSGNVASRGHLRVYNSIFRRTTDGAGSGTVGLRIYTDSNGWITNFNDIHIENNVFADWANTKTNYGSAIRIANRQPEIASTSTDCTIQNNIVLNCGGPNWQALKFDFVTDNWTFSHNLVNAGVDGRTTTSDWVQSNGQSGAPTFTSYTPYADANVFALASNDTSAKDHGATLTLGATDRLGVARPQGAAWDIGAFEYQSGEGSPPETNSVIRFVTVRANRVMVSQ